MHYIRVISGVVLALAIAATASAGSIEDRAQGKGGEVDVAIDISEKTFTDGWSRDSGARTRTSYPVSQPGANL
jgi:hypothetical protein